MKIQVLEKAIENLEYKVAKLEFEVYKQRRTIGQLITEKADRKTEQTDCETCRHYKLACELFSEVCKYEPITQTKTQNSNLTFEKRTMRDCYNCKKYETEGECIECHYEPKDEPKLEGIWNAGYKTGYDKGYKDAQKVKDSQGLVNDLVKAFCEDGTWLERQGVYTLTLAEAKQRAVDIIESIIERKEGE